MHHALHADQLNDQRKNQIQQTGNNDTATGIGQLLTHCHIRENACIQIGNCLESAEEREG